MKYFPIYLDTGDLRILVVGGGETALQKLRLLSKTEATIVVVAESFDEEIQKLAQPSGNGNSLAAIELITRPFDASDVIGKGLVYAASDNEGLDLRVVKAAKAAGVLVNYVDTPEHCDFITPSLVERDPITVAIGTEGTAPLLAREIKALLDRQLPANFGELGKQAKRIRNLVKSRITSGKGRLRVWERLMQGAFRRAVLAGDSSGADLALEAEIMAELEGKETEKGSVALIGAGPGNPELLTLKAHQKLQEADVLVIDRLVNPQVLDYARRDAKRIYVGKQAGKPSTSQEEINQTIVREALGGARVVRVKGGDPNIFGRIQEELSACQLFGIEVEVVPGISAAQAASASIKLPLTARGEHRSITLLTAATRDKVIPSDVADFLKSGRPFAIYMGVKLAADISETLEKSGADMSTEVIIVENASQKEERIISTNLRDLPLSVKSMKINGPAIMFVGLSYEEMGLTADPRIETMELNNVISLTRRAI